MLRLTPQDVQQLLAPETAGAARFMVAGKLTSHYGAESYDAREAVLAEQIFRLMARDRDESLRVAIAESLKSTARLPRDIAFTLASDPADAVALPMLRESKALSESDLISLVQASEGVTRHVAVGSREQVPEALVQALLETAQPEVAAALAGNSGARLDEAALAAIARRFAGSPEVAAALGSRSSEAKKAKARKTAMRTVKEKKPASTAPFAIGVLPNWYVGGVEAEKIADQLQAFNQLGPRLLIGALAAGQTAFFEAAMARLAAIPTENARRLLADRGGLGYRGLYNKAGLPTEFAGEVRLLFSIVHELLGQPGMRAGELCLHASFARLKSAVRTASTPNLSAFIDWLAPEVNAAPQKE